MKKHSYDESTVFEMEIFGLVIFLIWSISALFLLIRHMIWKDKRRKDDKFLDLAIEQNEDGNVKYLVSFFTGRGYSHAPSGNVRLHLIGSLYPGQFHTLNTAYGSATIDNADNDDDEDDKNESGQNKGDTYSNLTKSTSRSTYQEGGTEANKTHKRLFPPNSHEKFVVREDVSLGRINTIVLQTEVHGKYPFWECETIIIRDVMTNEAWYFRARCKIGFPPTILQPAPLEELTTFLRSWQRRVRREIRHGQYVLFGYWFKARHSVYTFSQRILIAVVCYFNLCCNTIIVFELLYPPKIETKNKNNGTSTFTVEIHSWFGHVTYVAFLASLATSLIGYILVTLFREKSKYEIRIQEMDYVIGTALQEYNQMKEEELKLQQETGKEIEKKTSSIENFDLNEKTKKSLENIFNDASPPKSQSPPGQSEMNVSVEASTSSSLDSDDTSVPPSPLLDEKGAPAVHNTIYQKFKNQLNDTFIKKSELSAFPEDKQPLTTSSSPKNTKISIVGPIQDKDKVEPKNESWSNFKDKVSKFNPFSKPKVDNDSKIPKLINTPRASTAHSSAQSIEMPSSSTPIASMSLFDKISSVLHRKQPDAETKPLLKHIEGETTDHTNSTSPVQQQQQQRKQSEIIPLAPILKRSTIFEPRRSGRSGPRQSFYAHNIFRITPAQQRQAMRRLFEGGETNNNMDDDTASYDTISIGVNSNKSDKANAKNYETIQYHHHHRHQYYQADGNAASGSSPSAPNEEGVESGVPNNNINMGLEHEKIKSRKFPRPILGWIAVLLVVSLPISAILIWISPKFYVLNAGNTGLTLHLILTIYIMSLFVETFLVEPMKLSLLGAYYAFTDKTIYKRIIRTNQKTKMFKSK